VSTYRALPQNLHSAADAAIKYFVRHHGVSQPKIEREVHPSVPFRPTLQFSTPDKHLMCAEVVEQLFPPELNEFILSCRNHGVPVKLFAVVAHGQFPTLPTQAIKFAQENGIGVLEVSSMGSGTELVKPVSLSLTGLRDFRLGDYPAKYRAALAGAIDTFRQGNPAKGCAQVYDELERLTRRIGKKSTQVPNGLKKMPAFDWDRESWATILDFLRVNINPVALSCAELKPLLFTRLMGMTEYRNDTGHKPASVARMIERDKQLRTRFESAMDELSQLIKAVAPLRL
jgi:hypothetical protein